MSKIKRFGDIPREPLFEGSEQVELKKLLGVDLNFKDVIFLESDLGEYAVFSFTLPGEKSLKSSMCGGQVVVKRLKYAQGKGLLPLRGKIIKEKAYYEII